MDGSKALFSRRSHSCQDHYLSFVANEDECYDIELHDSIFNRSSVSDEESVFTDDRKTSRDEHGAGRKVSGANVLSSRSTASGEAGSRARKSSSTRSHHGFDDVDMAVQSSKATDVSKGNKRRKSENRDFVYKFNWFDVCIGVGSILVYFVDVVTDIKLAVDYFLDSQMLFGGVTTALIIGPSLVTCCFGLHWYIIDYKMEKKVMKKYSKAHKYFHVTPPRVWFCRFFFTALQFGPVVR